MYNKVYLFLNNGNINSGESVFFKTISMKYIWNNMRGQDEHWVLQDLDLIHYNAECI